MSSKRAYTMILENDEASAVLLDSFLESKGVHWRTACGDARQAVIQAEALKIILVLSDLQLANSPFGGGVDAYKMMRQSHYLSPELPFIFLTDLPRESAVKIAPIKDPRVRLLFKPLDLVVLEKAIRELTGDLVLTKGNETPAASPPAVPVRPAPAATPAAQGSSRPRPVLPPSRKARGGRTHVLVVEDDEQSAEMLCVYLESRNIRWRTNCVDARTALSQAESMHPGLVLMDIMLSGPDTGIACYQFIRRSPVLDKTLPILFMTALTPQQVAKVLPKNDPYVRIVYKPLKLDVLDTAVRALTGDLFLPSL